MPETAEQLSTLLEQAKKKQWAALEAAWLERVAEPVADAAFFGALAQALIKFHEEPRLEEMVSLHAAAHIDAGRPLDAVRIIRAVLRVKGELNGLAPALIRALEAAYGDRPSTAGCLRAAGLTEPASLGKALGLFELMMMTVEGSVFRHKTWGLGIVVAQDLAARTATVEFGGTRRQTFNFPGIREFLERIPPSHILAEITRNPEGVRERAQRDPVSVVRQAVENLGRRVKQSDLKAMFVPAVFTPAQWSRWWTAAKDRLRLDPMMEVGLGAHGEIALRETPRSAADDVLARLREATTPHARQQAVREAIRFAKSGALASGELAPVSEALRAGHGAATSPADALTWAYLAEELAEAVPGDAPLWRPDTAALLFEMGGDADLIGALAIGDHQQRALEQIRARVPHRFGDLCVMLIDSVNLTLARWMMKELMAEETLHHAAEDALATLLHDPAVHTEAYLWAMRQVLGGPWAHLSVANDAPHLLERVLIYLEDIQRRIDREDGDRQALRGVATRIRNALEENRHELVVHTLRELPVEHARPLYLRMMGMVALSDAWKVAAQASLQSVRGDLDTGRGPEEEQEFLYVTAAKLREKQSELQHIRSVEIPENSRDIQTAREHGDLRENAEYKAAKERQTLLHKRMAELEALLSRARPILPETVTGEMVVPGTRVRLRNTGTGEEEVYTLLGLWDAEPEHGVISYLSPFGSQFLRRRPGETLTVNLPSGESHGYEILSIERAV